MAANCINYILLFLYLPIVIMVLIGIIFDERDKNYWFVAYYIFSFAIGIQIGKYFFS